MLDVQDNNRANFEVQSVEVQGSAKTRLEVYGSIRTRI